MAADNSARRIPLWKQGTLVNEALPLRLSSVARGILVLVGAMGAVAGSIAGLLCWLQPAPSPYFVPLWSVEYRSPLLPLNVAADRDRAAIIKGNYFQRCSTVAVSSQDRDLIVRELNALAGRSPRDSIIVYLCAFAGTDAQGVFIMPGDFDPDDPHSRIPLREVLRYLERCPANRQLLVLDIMWPTADALLGILSDDVAAAVQGELHSRPDPRRITLCAASGNQVALSCESLGRSAFGYYFEQALLGYADGYNPQGVCDGRVTADELAAFVQARVGRWAWQARGRVQIPKLYGNGQDFELVAAAPPAAVPASEEKSPEYPAWLLDGWKARDQWRAQRIGNRFPRLCRQLEAQLLFSEFRWRMGADPARTKSDFEARQEQLSRRLRGAEASLAAPRPRLLSMNFAPGQSPNPAVVDTVRNLLASIDPPDSGVPLLAAQAKQAKLLDDFEQKNKEVAYEDLAAAVLEVVRQLGSPAVHEIRLLDAVLRKRQPQPQFVETNFLHDMALLTDQIPQGAWPAATVRTAMQAVDLSCRDFSRARTFAWVAPWLRTAANQQHQAAIFLGAPGYAPLDEADDLFRQSSALCQASLAYQDLVAAAYHSFDDAGDLLLDYQCYLPENPNLAANWLTACSAAKELADVLEIELSRTDTAKLAGSIEQVRLRAGILQASLQELRQPFSPERMAELVRQCHSADAGTTILDRADSILSTPILRGPDRVALWTAMSQLAQRLDARVLGLDAVDNQHAGPGADLSACNAIDAPPQPLAASLRLRENVAILALGGVANPQLETLKRHADSALHGGKVDPADVYQDAVLLRGLWAHVVQADLSAGGPLPPLDRLARVVSPLEPSVLLDDPATNPIVRLWRQQHLDLWAFLGEHFRYELLEHPGSLFYQQAAGDYAAFTGPASNYLEIDGPKEIPSVSSSVPRAAARFRFHNVDADNSVAPAKISFRQSDVDALSLKSPEQQALPNQPFSVEASWRSGADTTGGIPPRGFLLELIRDGRSFHFPVSVAAAAAPGGWDILVSPNSQQPLPVIGDWRVRPLRGEQPFYLYVGNPDPRAREIVVQLNGDTPATAKMTVGPHQTARVIFSGAAPTPNMPLPLLTKPPTVRVVDGGSGDVLAERSFDIAILSPREYVQITAARFQPQAAGPNRLVVSMRDAALAGGAPSVASLVLLPGAIPGLETVGSGALRGLLSTGGQELTLFAGKLLFTPGTSEQGRFYLNIDGRPRSFIFDATFGRQGDITTAQEVLEPGIALQASAVGQAGPGFPVGLEVDNPPAGSSVDVALGRGAEQDFQPELTQTYPAARDEQIRFSPFGPAGALLVHASSQDWNVSLDTTGLVGRVELRARLLDADGHAVRTAWQPLMLDDSPPAGLLFDAPRGPVAWKTPFQVRAIGTDNLSGVSRVRFFVGPPVDGKLPAGAAPVEGHSVTADKTVWSAEMTLPEAPVDRLQLSAEFSNGAGLSSFVTTEVPVVSPTVLNQGRIAGKVLEGPRPQSGLTVTLKTGGAGGAEQGKAVTQADGTFAFEQLSPGTYTLATQKPISYRQAEQQVQVAAGNTTSATLELSIQKPAAAAK